MLLLEAEGLTCVRGGRLVFSGLGFAARGGEALQVRGPNGAGKSSLLRLVAGLLPAEAGRISLRGGDAEASIAEQAHYCGHLDAFKGALTAAENLQFWARFLGGDPAAAQAALARLGIAHAADLPARHLSAGQRRRLALARLLAVPRPLWLLDEPTAALDSAGQGLLAELMSEHLAAGGLVIAATHGPLGIAARPLDMGAGR